MAKSGKTPKNEKKNKKQLWNDYGLGYMVLITLQ